MYHIKQDRRALLSAKMLEEGLALCLSSKKLPEISVSELCEAANVSRTTFYRLFDTPADVLQHSADRLAEEAAVQFAKFRAGNIAEYISMVLDYIDGYMPGFVTILRSDRPDIITDALEKLSESSLQSETLENFTPEEREYIHAAIAALAVSCYKVNRKHGWRETTRDINAIIQKILRLMGAPAPTGRKGGK